MFHVSVVVRPVQRRQGRSGLWQEQEAALSRRTQTLRQMWPCWWLPWLQAITSGDVPTRQGHGSKDREDLLTSWTCPSLCPAVLRPWSWAVPSPRIVQLLDILRKNPLTPKDVESSVDVCHHSLTSETKMLRDIGSVSQGLQERQT